MNPIRLALVDDHLLVRSGLRKLLEGDEEFEIVGEAGNSDEAIDLVRRTQPHVVLMDLSLPGKSGLETTAQIHRELPNVQVIIVSMYETRAFIREAKAAGASGYVVKDRSPKDLEDAIRRVVGGETFVTPSEEPEMEHDSPIPGKTGLEALTGRQIEILRHVASGKSHRDIAKLLHIAEKTVEHHRSNLKRVLGISDTAGLVLFAVRHGLVSPGDLDRRGSSDPGNHP